MDCTASTLVLNLSIYWHKFNGIDIIDRFNINKQWLCNKFSRNKIKLVCIYEIFPFVCSNLAIWKDFSASAQFLMKFVENSSFKMRLFSILFLCKMHERILFCSSFLWNCRQNAKQFNLMYHKHVVQCPKTEYVDVNKNSCAG